MRHLLGGYTVTIRQNGKSWGDVWRSQVTVRLVALSIWFQIWEAAGERVTSKVSFCIGDLQEPLRSTKQNSIRFWRIQTEAIVWEPTVKVSQWICGSGFKPGNGKCRICGENSDEQSGIIGILLVLEIVSSNEGAVRRNVNWTEYRT